MPAAPTSCAVPHRSRERRRRRGACPGGATSRRGRCRRTARSSPPWRTTAATRPARRCHADDRAASGGIAAGIVGDLAWRPTARDLAFSCPRPDGAARLVGVERGACVARALWRPDPATEAGIDPAGFIAPALVAWRSAIARMFRGGWRGRAATRRPGGSPIIWVHGGPASQTRANFRADIQMLLDRVSRCCCRTCAAPPATAAPGWKATTSNAATSGSPILAARGWPRAAGIDPAPDRHHGPVLRRLDGARRDHLPSELWARRRLLRHRRLGHAAGGYRSLAARPSRPRIRLPGGGRRGVGRISPLRRVGAVSPLLVLHADRDPRVPMTSPSSSSGHAGLRQAGGLRAFRMGGAWFQQGRAPPAAVPGGGGAFPSASGGTGLMRPRPPAAGCHPRRDGRAGACWIAPR